MCFLFIHTNGETGISSMEPNNNNYKKHSREDQALMPVNGQVHFGRCKTPGYKNISEREYRASIVFSSMTMRKEISNQIEAGKTVWT